MASSYLFDDVINVIINFCLSVNSIRIRTSINIVFQEEVLECHQIFLPESDNHLVAQPKRHQLGQGKGLFLIKMIKQHNDKHSSHV